MSASAEIGAVLRQEREHQAATARSKRAPMSSNARASARGPRAQGSPSHTDNPWTGEPLGLLERLAAAKVGRPISPPSAR
jgi:hypothetical protein